MEEVLEVQVKETCCTLTPGVGDDGGIRVMPASRCLCVQATARESTLGRGEDGRFSGEKK